MRNVRTSLALPQVKKITMSRSIMLLEPNPLIQDMHCIKLRLVIVVSIVVAGSRIRPTPGVEIIKRFAPAFSSRRAKIRCAAPKLSIFKRFMISTPGGVGLLYKKRRPWSNRRSIGSMSINYASTCFARDVVPNAPKMMQAQPLT